MIVGVATVAAVSNRWGYRLGGVMTVPLLAVYTFREPLSPLVFAVGTIAAWAGLWVTREYTLNHGRRVFLVAILTGAFATVGFAYLVAFHTSIGLPFDDAEVVASIFPGIAAYNLMRLDREQRLTDILASAGLFTALLSLGVAGLVFLEGRSPPTPPVVALPTSDLVTWLGLEPRGEAFEQIIPDWLAIGLLVADVSIYEAVRKRYDLRLLGVILVPLLAVFSVRSEVTVLVFAIGALAVFVLVSVVHWISLLYGRVLLGISLALGSCFVLSIGVFTTAQIPGLTLYFIGLFTGVAGYNLHHVSPPLRAASVRLSAGLFVVFYLALLVVVDVPSEGLYHGTELGYTVLGVLAVGFAARELISLERSRPSRSAFARASVFADLDGIDVSGSPLVDGADEPDSTGERRSTRPQEES